MAVWAALLAAAPVCAAPVKVVSETPLSAPDAYRQLVTSRITGRAYEVRVWAPLTAQGRADPAARALWVIGRDTDAELAAAVVRTRPEASVWVVGVSPVESAEERAAGRFASWKSARLRQEWLHRPLDFDDFSPRMGEPAVSAGDGAGFQRFLLEELKPLIAARHPHPQGADVLAGEGLAGTFVLTVAARAPQAFDAYVVSNPRLDKATVASLAAAVPQAEKHSWAVKLTLNWTTADHLWTDPEREIGQAFIDHDWAARWSNNKTWTEMLGGLS